MILSPLSICLKGSLVIMMAGAMACSQPTVDTPPPTQVANVTAETNGAAPTSREEILSELSHAQVIYLGETHNSLADHQAQLEIIEALHQVHGEVAIAMEMFQRPFQPILDQYLAEELTEAELITQTEYETRWGFSWELYAPIIRYAQANQLPILALNTPTEVTRKVAREGLSSLQGEDLTYIPPIDQIDTTDEAYKAFVSGVFGAHAHGEFDLDNFFAAQVLWDETMAAQVSTFAQANPSIPVIVLAGEGHIIYDFGIPNRVQRRLGDELKQTSLILNPTEEILAEGEGNIADFFWITP